MTGDAPRYFGSREKWQLMQPCRGMSRMSSFRNCPNATTAMTSGFFARSQATASGALTFSGVMHSTMPRARAYFRHGHGVRSRPRPAGRSGCVTTPTTWRPGSRRIARRHMADACDEPMKTMRMALV